MNAPASKPFTLAALIAALRLTARRRPLWKLNSAADLLDVDPGRVMEKIQDGTLPAFNLGTGTRKTEPRILSAAALEQKFGIDPSIGAAKNLKLPAVINLILPARSTIRSTELRRLLSCDHQLVHHHKTHWTITRQPRAADGPHSFTVFSRASIAAWLATRRMT